MDRGVRQLGQSKWITKSRMTVRLSLSGCCSPNKDLSQAAVFFPFKYKMLLSIDLSIEAAEAQKLKVTHETVIRLKSGLSWDFQIRSPDSVCG